VVVEEVLLLEHIHLDQQEAQVVREVVQADITTMVAPQLAAQEQQGRGLLVEQWVHHIILQVVAVPAELAVAHL
jgi:hypothetical protein